MSEQQRSDGGDAATKTLDIQRVFYSVTLTPFYFSLQLTKFSALGLACSMCISAILKHKFRAGSFYIMHAVSAHLV